MTVEISCPICHQRVTVITDGFVRFHFDAEGDQCTFTRTAHSKGGANRNPRSLVPERAAEPTAELEATNELQSDGVREALGECRVRFARSAFNLFGSRRTQTCCLLISTRHRTIGVQPAQSLLRSNGPMRARAAAYGRSPAACPHWVDVTSLNQRLETMRTLVLACIVLSSLSIVGCSKALPDPEAIPTSTELSRAPVQWEDYAAELKANIDDMAALPDCAGLQNEFDIADANSEATMDRVGHGNAELMRYVDEAMRLAHCY